jgi:hypothetical protein
MTTRPPERVPVDVDAGIAVAEALGLIDVMNHETAVAEALDLHASGYPDRARVHFVTTMNVGDGEEWDAIVLVAELVGRRKLEDGAP